MCNAMLSGSGGDDATDFNEKSENKKIFSGSFQ